MNTKSTGQGWCRMLSAVLSVMCATAWPTFPAVAQQNAGATSSAISPLDKATQEGLRRQEEQDRQQQQRLQPTGSELKPDAFARDDDPIPQDDPCFVVHQIDLIQKTSDTGSRQTTHPFHWFGSITNPYLHQCLGSSALRQLLGRLNQSLLAHGYTTSKVSPGPQNLRAGTLTLQLDIGRVSNVAMLQADTSGSHQPDQSWGTFRNAFPVSPEDVLNIHAIEQGLEQMKRLASQNGVKTLIKPAELPDTSVIDIVRPMVTLRDRLHGGLTLDNSGNNVMGRSLVSGYLVLDNPLGLNDLINLSASSNVEQPSALHRSQSLNLAYSIPWGYTTLSLSYGRARFAQNVQGTTATFLSSGGSETLEARLNHTLWRSGSAKLGAFVAVAGRTADSFINEVELVVQKRRVFNSIVGANFKKLAGDAKWDGELSYRQGRTWFRAEEDITVRDPNGPSLRPRIAYANLSLTTPIQIPAIAGFGSNPGSTGVPTRWDYTATLRAQHTPDKSLSIDQLGIGSRFTVRGFDGSAVLLGESGYTLRQDLSRPLPGLLNGILPSWLSKGAEIEATGYAALDMGRIWGQSADPKAGSKLAGLAIGLRAKQAGLTADIGIGTPLYRPPPNSPTAGSTCTRR